MHFNNKFPQVILFKTSNNTAKYTLRLTSGIKNKSEPENFRSQNLVSSKQREQFI